VNLQTAKQASHVATPGATCRLCNYNTNPDRGSSPRHRQNFQFMSGKLKSPSIKHYFRLTALNCLLTYNYFQFHLIRMKDFYIYFCNIRMLTITQFDLNIHTFMIQIWEVNTPTLLRPTTHILELPSTQNSRHHELVKASTNIHSVSPLSQTSLVMAAVSQLRQC